ncbi:MFS transporter [Streptomyces fuscichromogenes]|uniref:MFS transporter n=1 Tax=Streptomyces fuscichromogenes TaxID=1324013 RepID=A0A918CXE8_9ACTN|nr:MFS transporter [Streptomyces fuscichromogenes]GGN45031.1 MFS transporter [Streptomyces fuscichromogenes]
MDTRIQPPQSAPTQAAAGNGTAGGLPAWLVARGLIPETSPKRAFAAATFINQIGKGLFISGAALFFTRSVGLPVARVGFALGTAALIGLAAGVPVGRLADRRGPREVFRLAVVVQALAVAGLVFVRTVPPLIAFLCVAELAVSAGTAARGPLTRALGAPNPTRYRSYLRALNNIALGCGALAAGVVVQLDTRTAYVSLILGTAVAFLLSAALTSRVPSVPTVKAPAEGGRWPALKDRPYVVLTVLDGLMSIQTQVLIFALPLWIIGHTQAPRWFVGASVAVNTALVVCLQVRVSRGVDNNAAAGRTVRRAGAAFLLATALIAAAGGAPGWVAMAVVVLGVVAHTVGELWHTAGSFELSFGLAPEHAQGQYSGLFAIGQGLSNAVGPPLLGLVCIGWGGPGWLVMGALFLAVGQAVPLVVNWSDRLRAHSPGRP